MRWAGQTVVCIASGPSLTAADCDAVRGQRVIVVNTTFQLAPWADVLYACDFRWWDRWHREARKVASGEFWTIDKRAAEQYGLRRVESVPGGGWVDSGAIKQGENSGFQAVGLAIAFGAARVVLLGYDMKPAANGRMHWHADHPRVNPVARKFPTWCAHFAQLAKESPVPIVNATRDTALTCFPRVTLAEALA